MIFKQRFKQSFLVNNTLLPMAIALSLSVVLPAHAQQEEGFKAKIDGSYADVDNVFRTSEKVSDSLITIAPHLGFNELYDRYRIRAQYDGNYNKYADNSNLDYTDHSVLLGAAIDHSARFSTEFLLSYQDKIELPGSNNAQAVPNEEFNATTASRIFVKGAYGADRSMGQIVLSYDINQYRYDNNEQQFRDVDSNKATAVFFYRATDKTRILLESSTADFDYLNTNLLDLSSTQNVYLAGVEWDSTGKTSSVFKIGYQDVDYENESVEDISGLSYFLDVFWQPSTRTQLRLGASRVTRETAVIDEGGYLSDRIEGTLSHDFTGLTNITIALANTEEDFTGESQRADSYTEATVKLSYAPKYWLDVYVSYAMTERESNQSSFEFDASTIRVGVTVSFD